MSELSAARRPRVRIVHRPDGTAVVDGVPVMPAEGQDVRDAAYQAAVRALPAAAGPVAATRVEADGREYPLMLYPAATDRPPARTLLFSDALRTALNRRPWPSRSRRAAAMCGCVLLTLLASATLLPATAAPGAGTGAGTGAQQRGPAMARLTADQENRAVRSPIARAIARGVAGAGSPFATPRTATREPGAAGSTGAGKAAAAAGGGPDPGARQTPHPLPSAAPAPHPTPHPTPTMTHAPGPAARQAAHTPAPSSGQAHAAAPASLPGRPHASAPALSTGRAHASAPASLPGRPHAPAPALSTGRAHAPAPALASGRAAAPAPPLLPGRAAAPAPVPASSPGKVHASALTPVPAHAPTPGRGRRHG